MTRVIQIDAAGVVRHLHADDLNLAGLGPVRVKRASQVEWESGEWTVTLRGARTPAYRHPSRAACLAWEVQTLNRRLAEGGRP